MAVFYLLPPRRVVGQQFHSLLTSVFPGLSWPERGWPDWAEALSATATHQPDVFVVYQEDLPADANPATVLMRDFGAESDDEVVEVKRGADGRLGEAGRWRMPRL
ncbi:MAG: hypothetical protein U0793_17605 [Gemmataceae bacterium]